MKVELKVYQNFLVAAEIHVHLNHKLQQHGNSILRLHLLCVAYHIKHI